MIVVIFEILTVAEGLPPFLALSNVRNILNQTAIDGIMAVSMTVLLITGNFDLSVGATAGLAGAVGVILVNSHGVVVGTLGALGVGLGVGLVNGGLVQGLGVSSFIVTLGSLTALQGILLILTNGLDIAATNGAFSSIGTGNWTIWYPVAPTVGVGLVVYSVLHAINKRKERGDSTGLVDRASIVAAVVGVMVVAVGVGAPGLLTQTREAWILLAYMGIVALVLRFTVVGRRVYAVGGNGEAARLSGVPVARYKIGAFLLTSLSASL
ncbi:MAG: ABC transporter permease subunit, partial [Candidatus Dormibacteria bacterium]